MKGKNAFLLFQKICLGLSLCGTVFLLCYTRGDILSAVVAAVILAVNYRTIFFGIKAIFKKIPDGNALAAVSSLICFAYSLYLTVANCVGYPQDVVSYYAVATAVLFFVSLSEIFNDGETYEKDTVGTVSAVFLALSIIAALIAFIVWYFVSSSLQSALTYAVGAIATLAAPSLFFSACIARVCADKKMKSSNVEILKKEAMRRMKDINCVFIGNTNLLDKKFIDLLKKEEYKIVLVTSEDSKYTAQRAKQTGVDDFYGNVSPQEKGEYVKKMQTFGGNVVYIGYDEKDVYALEQADVALVSEGGKLDSFADIVSNDLSEFFALKKGSLNLSKVIRQNLILSAVCALVVLPLAVGAFSSLGVLLTPPVAVAYMTASTLLVFLNSLKLKK